MRVLSNLAPIFALILLVGSSHSIQPLIRSISLGKVQVKGRSTDVKTFTAFEAFDPGRFISNGLVFARVEIPRTWLKSGSDKSWYTLDVDACPQPESLDVKWVCAEANTKERAECTPTSIDGCPMTVLVVDNANFVDNSLVMRNGSVIKFSVIDDRLKSNKTVKRPPSGIFLATLPEQVRLVINETKIKGNAKASTYNIQPLKAVALDFAKPASLQQIRDCKSFVAHATSDGVVIRGCHDSLAQTFVDFAKSYLLYLVVMASLLLVLVIGALFLQKYLKRRQKKFTIALGKAEEGKLVANENAHVEDMTKKSEDTAPEQEQVTLTETAVSYKKSSKAPRDLAVSTSSDPTEHAPDSPFPEDPQATSAATGKWPHPLATKKLRRSKSLAPGDVDPQSRASTSSISGRSAGLDVEKKESNADTNASAISGNAFSSVKLIDFASQIVSEHVPEAEKERAELLKNLKPHQWDVISEALTDLALEMNMAPNYTGRFKDIALNQPEFGCKFHGKRGKVVHQSAARFYKNNYRINVKYPELPMVLLGYHKNPIPAEMINITDKSLSIENRLASAKTKYSQHTCK